MEPSVLLSAVETLLRIILGLRFLSSGLSNIRRWPSAVDNARLVVPFGETFFGLVAVFLMVAGGIGLALGFHTQLAALMIVLFLIPTFPIHRHWLRTTPAMIEKIRGGLSDEETLNQFRLMARHAFHSHETGWQNNIVFLVVALFYAVRGSSALGLDNWIR